MSGKKLHLRTISIEEQPTSVFFDTSKQAKRKSINLETKVINKGEKLIMEKLLKVMNVKSSDEGIDDVVNNLCDTILFYKSYIQSIIYPDDFNQDWTVKLTITEIAKANSEKMIRKIVSPILTTSNHFEFG